MQWKHTIWLCLLAVLRSEAAIYQWTDSTGTVQFSDRRPTEQVEVIERRDIKAGAAVAPPPPLPKRAAKPAQVRKDSPHKTRPGTARASSREQAQQRCDKLRRRIAATQSKLRAGYSASRGITLTERLRADRDTLYHECRY